MKLYLVLKFQQGRQGTLVVENITE